MFGQTFQKRPIYKIIKVNRTLVSATVCNIYKENTSRLDHSLCRENAID